MTGEGGITGAKGEKGDRGRLGAQGDQVRHKIAVMNTHTQTESVYYIDTLSYVHTQCRDTYYCITCLVNTTF